MKPPQAGPATDSPPTRAVLAAMHLNVPPAKAAGGEAAGGKAACGEAAGGRAAGGEAPKKRKLGGAAAGPIDAMPPAFLLSMMGSFAAPKLRKN